MPDPLLTEFALGLAGHVAEALLDASARTVWRKFEGGEQQKALRAALLRRQVGKLPHRRVLLYERYVSTLIENWAEARTAGARERSLDRLDLHHIESILVPHVCLSHQRNSTP